MAETPRPARDFLSHHGIVDDYGRVRRGWHRLSSSEQDRAGPGAQRPDCSRIGGAGDAAARVASGGTRGNVAVIA
jgi:hypothetical protein